MSGSGLYGDVWLARQLVLDRLVAVKFLRPSMAHAIDLLEQARALVRAGAHPNVVAVYSIEKLVCPGTDERADAVVMEWIAGEKLSDRLKGAKLDAAFASMIIAAILDGLGHIHSKGLAHGDLHGGNVMLTEPGGVKIIDIDYAASKSLAVLTSMSRIERIAADIESASYLIRRILRQSELSIDVVQQYEDPLIQARTLVELRALVHATMSGNRALPVKEPLAAEAIRAIESSDRRQKLLLNRYMIRLVKELEAIDPAPGKDGEADEQLLAAISASVPLVREFGDLVITVAALKSDIAIEAIHQGFASFLERYEMRGNGAYYETQFDFFKFSGHELFTMFIAGLLRERLYAEIGDILAEPIYVEGRRGEDVKAYPSISEYVRSLDLRNKRLKLNRTSVHADILQNRHDSDPIAEVTPAKWFMAADFLLFMRNANWRPWSAVYLRQAPRFLFEARYEKNIPAIVAMVGVSNTEELKDLIKKRSEYLANIFGHHADVYPLEDFNLNALGTL